MKWPVPILCVVAFAAGSVHAKSDDADALWQKSEASRAEAAGIVKKLVRKPLTVSGAVRIALLNNRSLQATFEDIGVAQADVLQAVTLPNPSVEFEVQFPVTAGALNRYAWVVAQEFVQLVMIPLKKRISEDALEAAQLRVAAQVLDLVAGVKKAYFTVQADQQLIARLKVIQETTAAALDLGQKQFKAGNITDLTLLQMQASYNEGRLDIAEAETDLEGHREDLNELLGLWGDQTDWEIEGDLPLAAGDEFSMRHLESLAVAQRSDLQASRRELASLVSALGLTKTFRYVPVLDFGFTGERDIDGALNMGPQFRVELPIFNQGQSRVARGQSELRRAQAKFEALAVNIRSDVRKNRDRLARLQIRATFYHDTALPDRLRIVNRAIPQYNAMQISAYELFTAKADELRVERGYIDTLRDYWITRAELERAVGGTLMPHKEAVATSTRKEKKP
ncbi:MAG: TolC family protein [Chthoniobacterales bacterium]